LELLKQGLDIFLHLDQHLNAWAEMFGPWLYVILFLVVFCETGLVVTPFLPGDSLLFAVGALCSIEGTTLSLPVMWVVLIVAAVLGDAVNYSIGAYLGPRVFASEHSRLLNREHLARTQLFYAKHGGKTIFLARFVPIIRTFAPFVAGIGKMSYAKFGMWNVSGAFAWVLSMTLSGYFFGQLPWVKQNFELVVLAIVAISLLPVVHEWWKARRGTPAVESA
jgi:membrane-associated protein